MEWKSNSEAASFKLFGLNLACFYNIMRKVVVTDFTPLTG
jgi:hypothetical protein